jgi:hypothetical protein
MIWKVPMPSSPLRLFQDSLVFVFSQRFNIEVFCSRLFISRPFFWLSTHIISKHQSLALKISHSLSEIHIRTSLGHFIHIHHVSLPLLHRPTPPSQGHC